MYLCAFVTSVVNDSLALGVPSRMGVLTKIRQASPVLMAVFAVVFIGFMVLSDSQCTGSQGPKDARSTVVGIVNGEEITLERFESSVELLKTMLNQQNPNGVIDDEQVREQAWNGLLQEIIIEQEAKKLGIVITPEEIAEVYWVEQPEYLTGMFADSTGRVNQKLYRDVISNPENLRGVWANSKMGEEKITEEINKFKANLARMEAGLYRERIQTALGVVVGAALSTSSAIAVEREWVSQNGVADVKFVRIPTSLVADAEVNVSDAEVSAYYEKNKQYYEQRPSRKLKTIEYRKVASESDSARVFDLSKSIGKELATAMTIEQRDSIFTRLVDTYSGQSVPFTLPSEIDQQLSFVLSSMQPREVFGPLTTPAGVVYFRLDGRREGTQSMVRASHILINSGSNPDSAKVEAEKVLARAQKGEDFATLAREKSNDPSVVSNNGDLGYFGKGRMVAEFETAAFGAAVGSVVGPIKTNYGYHVIKVVDKNSTEIAYTQILLRPTISQKTVAALKTQAARAVAAIESGANIDSVAKNDKLRAAETPFFQARTPMLNSRQMTSWAFANEKGAAKVFDVPSRNALYVVQVMETRSEGIKPLEDVKDQIKATLLRVKKLDKLKERAQQIAQQAQSLGLDALQASNPSLEVRTFTALRDNGQIDNQVNEFAVTHAAFNEPVGGVSKAIRGENAWYVLNVTNRVPADVSAFSKDRAPHLQAASMRKRNEALYPYIMRKLDLATIEDKRDANE